MPDVGYRGMDAGCHEGAMTAEVPGEHLAGRNQLAEGFAFLVQRVEDGSLSQRFSMIALIRNDPARPAISNTTIN